MKTKNAGLIENGPSQEDVRILNDYSTENGSKSSNAQPNASPRLRDYSRATAECSSTADSLALAPFKLLKTLLKDSEILTEFEVLRARLTPVIKRALTDDPQLATALKEILLEGACLVSSLMESVAQREKQGRPLLDQKSFERMETVARQLAQYAPDDRGMRAIEDAKSSLHRFVDRTADESFHAIMNWPSPKEKVSESSGIFALSPLPFRITLSDVVKIGPDGYIPAIIAYHKAEEAIANKAAQLGSLSNGPLGDVDFVGKGFVRRFAGCDIYYSDATGAHEVHGDIRAKYNALGGAAGVLGLPTTDETGTPDGVGRFNHFQGGSIYWTPHTGPMMVRGAIRDRWASQGWERGALGYPVADEHRMVTVTPLTDPQTYWSIFENGAIVTAAGETGVALTADISPDDLRMVVRRFFDEAFHAKDVNIGLEAQVDFLGVQTWGYGFWASTPRKISYRLHGFHDNGLILPDTTFELEVRLVFGTAWANSFTEPQSKTLIIGLESVTVNAHGIASQAVADGVKDGVWGHFYPDQPDPSRPEWLPNGWIAVRDIPTGADLHGPGINVIGLFLTQAGGLSVLLNPVPPFAGAFRKSIAQTQLNNFVEGGG